MTLNIQFSPSLPQEQGRHILMTLAKCKTTGYTISRANGKLRQLYHSSLGRDKVDSIIAWLRKEKVSECKILVDGSEIVAPKTKKAKKVS